MAPSVQQIIEEVPSVSVAKLVATATTVGATDQLQTPPEDAKDGKDIDVLQPTASAISEEKKKDSARVKRQIDVEGGATTATVPSTFLLNLFAFTNSSSTPSIFLHGMTARSTHICNLSPTKIPPLEPIRRSKTFSFQEAKSRN
jgi:hypothetical protein